MRKPLRLFTTVLMAASAFAAHGALAQTALEQDMRYQDTATMTVGETVISLGGGFAYLTLPDTRFTFRYKDSGTFNTATKTSGYTITATDTVIFANAASGSVVITLPTAASFAGYRFYVKRIDGSANSCSVARSGSDTIDGQASISLDLQYTSMTIVSDGSAWYII